MYCEERRGQLPGTPVGCARTIQDCVLREPFPDSASSKKSHSSMTHMGSSPRPTKMIDTPASYEYQHGFAVVADGRRTMAEAMVWDSNRPMRKV